MRLLIVSAILAGQLVSAQVILVVPGAEDPELVVFNPEFIARNDVKTIKGQAWTKRDGRPMLPQKQHFLYRFEDAGKLGYSNNSFGDPGSGMDTASVMYSYDTKGRMLQEMHNDRSGYYAWRSEYDEHGRRVHATNIRLENLSTDRYKFVEGATTIISDERFAYRSIDDTTWQKTYHNDRGRAYREETFTMDGLGYQRSIADRNLITQRRGLTTFQYDQHGRLAERVQQTDLSDPQVTIWRWTYDDAGNPLSRDLLRNGILARHSEYLYAEGTLFLKAVITKNNETGVIEILQYQTTRTAGKNSLGKE